MVEAPSLDLRDRYLQLVSYSSCSLVSCTSSRAQHDAAYVMGLYLYGLVSQDLPG